MKKWIAPITSAVVAAGTALYTSAASAVSLVNAITETVWQSTVAATLFVAGTGVAVYTGAKAVYNTFKTKEPEHTVEEFNEELITAEYEIDTTRVHTKQQELTDIKEA